MKDPVTRYEALPRTHDGAACPSGAGTAGCVDPCDRHLGSRMPRVGCSPRRGEREHVGLRLPGRAGRQFRLVGRRRTLEVVASGHGVPVRSRRTRPCRRAAYGTARHRTRPARLAAHHRLGCWGKEGRIKRRYPHHRGRRSGAVTFPPRLSPAGELPGLTVAALRPASALAPCRRRQRVDHAQLTWICFRTDARGTVAELRPRSSAPR